MNKILWLLLNPSHWIRNERTSNVLTKWYEEKILDGVKFTNIGTHTATFDNQNVWISNYPYCCFNLLGDDGLPKRRTVKKLHDLLMDSKLNKSSGDSNDK
jgi:hypothetical protein